MEDDPFDDFGGDDFEAALVAAAEAVEAKKRLVVDCGSLQAQSTNKQKCVHQPSAKTVPLPRPAYVKPAPAAGNVTEIICQANNNITLHDTIQNTMDATRCRNQGKG